MSLKKTNTSFFQRNWSTDIQETKEHTCLNFLIEKSKLTHRHSCYCKIVQEAKFFFLKITLIVFPRARKLVISTHHWHILYVVLSPLTLQWVLRGDQKQGGGESFCTNNENKAKVRVHRGHTPLGRAAPDGSGLGARPPFTRGLAWGVVETIPDNNNINNKTP